MLVDIFHNPNPNPFCDLVASELCRNIMSPFVPCNLWSVSCFSNGLKTTVNGHNRVQPLNKCEMWAAIHLVFISSFCEKQHFLFSLSCRLCGFSCQVAPSTTFTYPTSRGTQTVTIISYIMFNHQKGRPFISSWSWVDNMYSIGHIPLGLTWVMWSPDSSHPGSMNVTDLVMCVFNPYTRE